MSQLSREERLIQKIDWALQRQLTWIALLLASGIGIVELLSIMERFLIVEFVIYELLVFSFLLCIYQLGGHTRDIAECQRRLPSGWGLTGERGIFLKIIFIKKVDGKFYRNKTYIILSQVIFFIFAQLLLYEHLFPNVFIDILKN